MRQSQNEFFSEADLGHGTYLTAYLGVEKNEFGYNICEGSHARKGVDLQKAKISSPTAQNPGILKPGAITTYPDRPPIAATSLDDTPLKVEGREELPAVKLLFELVILCKRKKLAPADSQKEAIHDVPKLRSCNFQKNTIIMRLNSR